MSNQSFELNHSNITNNSENFDFVSLVLFCFIFSIPILIILRIFISITLKFFIKIFESYSNRNNIIQGIVEKVEFFAVSSLPENIKIIESHNCSICLEDLDLEIKNDTNEICIFECGHQYHKHCIEEWCKYNHLLKCPLCNRNIKNIYIIK